MSTEVHGSEHDALAGPKSCDVFAGFRDFPYDDAFPDKFDAVGKGRYRGPHPIGEIWCATLMMATSNLTATLVDKPRAYAIAWQCVVDGLKLTPPTRASWMRAMPSATRSTTLGRAG